MSNDHSAIVLYKQGVQLFPEAVILDPNRPRNKSSIINSRKTCEAYKVLIPIEIRSSNFITIWSYIKTKNIFNRIEKALMMTYDRLELKRQ